LNKITKNKKKIKTQYQDSSEEEIRVPQADHLHFDAAFESGNLYSAFKTSENEYDLIL